MKIVTTHVYPPIPIRQFDWQAHYDSEADEQMNCGHGRTEAEAVVDLLDNHPRCKDEGGYVGTMGECMLCDAEQGVACRLQTTRTMRKSK